jgi:hypothetical protein
LIDEKLNERYLGYKKFRHLAIRRERKMAGISPIRDTRSLHAVSSTVKPGSTTHPSNYALTAFAKNNNNVERNSLDHGSTDSKGENRLVQVWSYYHHGYVWTVQEKPWGYVAGEDIAKGIDDAAGILTKVYRSFCSLFNSFSFPAAAAAPTHELKKTSTISLYPGRSPTTEMVLPNGVSLSCGESTLVGPDQNGHYKVEALCVPTSSDSSMLGLSMLSPVEYLSTEEANAALRSNFLQLTSIDRQIAAVGSDVETDSLFDEMKQLLDSQAGVISRLSPGTMITADKAGQVVVVNDLSEIHARLDANAIAPYKQLAQSTGGIFGLSQAIEDLPTVATKMVSYILGKIPPGMSLDLVFMVDATHSMTEEMPQLKNVLRETLSWLPEMKIDLQVGIVLYRDSIDPAYPICQMLVPLTKDLKKAEEEIDTIQTHGGAGDWPEATYDAIIYTLNAFSWNPNNRHVVIGIGDAEPHPMTRFPYDGKHMDLNGVIQKIQDSLEVIFCPILSAH